MKKWLRVVALLLVAVMMFTMVAACKKKPADPTPSEPNNPSNPSTPSDPVTPEDPSDPSDPVTPDDPTPEIPLTKAQILAAIKAAGVSTMNAKVKAKFNATLKAPALSIEDYKIANFEKDLDDLTIADIDVSDVVKALLLELAFNSSEDAKFETTSDLLNALISALGTFGGNLDTDFGGLGGYVTEKIAVSVIPMILASTAIDVIAPVKGVPVYVTKNGGNIARVFDAQYEEIESSFDLFYDGMYSDTDNKTIYVWNDDESKYEQIKYNGEYYYVESDPDYPVPSEGFLYGYTFTGRVFDQDAYDKLVADLEKPIFNMITKVFKGAAISEVFGELNTVCELIGKKDEDLLAALKSELVKFENAASKDDYLGALTVIYCEAIVYSATKDIVDDSEKFGDEIYDSVILYEKDGKLYTENGTEYVLKDGLHFASERTNIGYAYFDDDSNAVYAGATLEAANKAKPEGKDIYARVLCTVLGYDPADYNETFDEVHEKLASIIRKAILDGTVDFYDVIAINASIVYPYINAEIEETDYEYVGSVAVLLLMKADFKESLKLVSDVMVSLGHADKELGKIADDIVKGIDEAEKAFSEAEEPGDYFTDVVLKVVSDVLGDKDNAAYLDEQLFGKNVSASIKKIVDSYALNGEAGTKNVLDLINVLITNKDADIGKLTTDLTKAIYDAMEEFAKSEDEDGDFFTDVILTAISNLLTVEEGKDNANVAYLDGKLGEGVCKDIKTLVDMLITGSIKKDDLIALCDKLIAKLTPPTTEEGEDAGDSKDETGKLPSSDEGAAVIGETEGEAATATENETIETLKYIACSILECIKGAKYESDDVSVAEVITAAVDGVLCEGATEEIEKFIAYYGENGGIEKDQLVGLCEYLLAMFKDIVGVNTTAEDITEYLEAIKAYAEELTPEEGAESTDITVTADDILIVIIKHSYDADTTPGEKTDDCIDALAKALKENDTGKIAEAVLKLALSSGIEYEDIFDKTVADDDKTTTEGEAETDGETVAEDDNNKKVVDLFALADFFEALVNYMNADEESLEAAEAELIVKVEAADEAYTNYMKNMLLEGTVEAFFNIGTVTRLAHIVIDLRTLDISEFMEKYGVDKVASVVSSVIAYAYVKADASKFDFGVYDLPLVFTDILYRIVLTDEEYKEVIDILEEEYNVKDINELLYYFGSSEGDSELISLDTYLARKTALNAVVKEYLELYFPTSAEGDGEDDVETVDDTDTDIDEDIDEDETVVEGIDDLLYILKIGNAIAPEYFEKYLTAYTDKEDETHEKFCELVEDDIVKALAGTVSEKLKINADVCELVVAILASPEKIVELAPKALEMVKDENAEYSVIEQNILCIISAVGHLAMDEKDITDVNWEDVLGFISLPEGYEKIDYAALAKNIREKTDILEEIEKIITAEVVPVVTDDSTTITFHVDFYYSFDVLVFDFDLDIEMAL